MATQINKAMTSETSICNQALLWLGSRTITSLSEAGTTAELCRNNYPFLRDALLEARHWTFATARETSISSDEPVFGEGFVHKVPLDWLRVSRVFRDVESADPNQWIPAVGWRREGEEIIAREEIIHMWGTKRITDTGKFSMSFVQCLAARLAADLCMAITQDKVREKDLYAIYLAKLADAAALDGAQGRSEIIHSKRLLDARLSGFRIRGGF